MLRILLLVALALAITHFTVPLAYYFYLKRFFKGSFEPMHRGGDKPLISIVIPTYNEAGLIREKLDNIYEQSYPREKIEVVIMDSGSSDGTAEIAEEWARAHRDINLRIIREPLRRGKAYALNEALKHVSGEIIVITDADSKWVNRDALERVVAYMSDPGIGALSCVKIPEKRNSPVVESVYRDFYNIVRVAESRVYSTPVFHGELAAFKKSVLREIGGFPTDIGSDDSHTATLVAVRGLRAVVAEDIICSESIPRVNYFLWRIRRAQHLIQHFAKSLKLLRRAPERFRFVLGAEIYLHLFNPWILFSATVLLVVLSLRGYALAMITLILGLLLLVYKPYRTWVATQLFLVIAAIRNLWSREIVWEKIPK